MHKKLKHNSRIYKFRLTIFILGFFSTLLWSDSNNLFANSEFKKAKIINIEITTHLGDKQTFVEGDSVNFLINLDTDSYLTVVYQDARGQLIQLLPNKKQENFYKAGFFISVPNTSSKSQFKIQAPYGEEIVWVFASDNPGFKLEGKKLKNGLILLSSTIDEIRIKAQQKSKASFGQANLVIHTKNK